MKTKRDISTVHDGDLTKVFPAIRKYYEIAVHRSQYFQLDQVFTTLTAAF